MKNINFLNTCLIQGWASEKDKIFRTNANNYMIKVINDSPFLSAEKDISVEYYQEGVSSIVAKLSISNNKNYVLKTNSRVKILLSEVISLRWWANTDINVPKIYEEKECDEIPYYIMDYFDGLTLKNLIDSNSISAEEIGNIMGSTLYKMQKVEGVGFGFPFTEEEGRLIGPTKTLKEYLEKEFTNQEKYNIVSKEFQETDWVKIAKQHIEILIKNGQGDISILGNMDFGPRHFFATKNPTMFDPFPELVPKYFDIAFYLAPEKGTTKGASFLIRKSTISTYLEKEGKINMEILRSAFWLLVYRKSSNLLKETDDVRFERASHMLSLIANKDLVDEHFKLYSLI